MAHKNPVGHTDWVNRARYPSMMSPPDVRGASMVEIVKDLLARTDRRSPLGERLIVAGTCHGRS